MKTIAVEEHFKNGTVESVNFYGPGVNERMYDLGTGRLAEMDAAGIDMQVLQYAGVGIQMMDREKGNAVAKESNDALAEVIRQHPGRYAGLAQMSLKDPEWSAKELDRSVKTLGLKGAVWSGTLNGTFLDDPSFDSFLSAAEKLNVPIYIHPGIMTPEKKEQNFGNLQPAVSQVLSMAAWGWHAEVGVECIRMVAAGVFDKHPDLKIVIGHLGEFLPIAVGRIDQMLAPVATYLKRRPIEYFQNNFYIAIAGYYDFAAFQCAVSTFGMDRIMFGADYPFFSNMAGRKFLESLPICKEDLEKISYKNAERIFKL